MSHWLSDPNLRWVLASTLLLGISSGMLGTFALLRRRSLMGDVLAHAALPGICLAFMLSGSKATGVLLAGAAGSGAAAIAAVNGITRYSRIKEDTALALVLSVFFGFGVLLLTRISASGAANQAGLNNFLFGKAASMTSSDVTVMAGGALLLTVLLAFFFHEFKLVCFDPNFGAGIGRPVRYLDNLLMMLITGAVVIGLQAVGVVLMAAMLITPAISARYWTDNLKTMVVLSASFGALSGIVGTWLSTVASQIATGPVIVLTVTFLFFVSMVFAPRRGLLTHALRTRQLRSEIREDAAVPSKLSLEPDMKYSNGE